MRLGDTPVPIPNTMVKTQTADGTILETVWESRWMPEPFFKGFAPQGCALVRKEVTAKAVALGARNRRRFR